MVSKSRMSAAEKPAAWRVREAPSSAMNNGVMADADTESRSYRKVRHYIMLWMAQVCHMAGEENSPSDANEVKRPSAVRGQTHAGPQRRFRLNCANPPAKRLLYEAGRMRTLFPTHPSKADL